MECNKNTICLEAFSKHWQHIVCSINGDDYLTSAEVICQHIDIMTSIILKECDEATASLKLILDFCDKNFIFQAVFDHFNQKNLQGNIKEYGFFNQLKMYKIMMSCLPNKYLTRYYLLSPLLGLLKECTLIHNSTIDLLAINILYQLTILVTRDDKLFQCVKYTSACDFKEPLLFVGLIILLIHHGKDIGRLSQEAMLLIFIYSKDYDSDIVQYICHRSDFAAMLVSGLREMYLSLPKKFDPQSDDWQQITADFVQSVPELKNCLQLLDFCSVILKMAHPKIQVEIIDYLQTGFLSLVIGPSLHQESTEENVIATAYLELFLRHLHHPLLTKLFLQFILKDKRDDYVILDSLLSRLDCPTMLGTITLSLFRTILSFHCEDVMFHLIIRYLIPCTHLVVQKWNHAKVKSSTEDLTRHSLRRPPPGQRAERHTDPTSIFNEDLSTSADRFLELSSIVLQKNQYQEDLASDIIQGFSSISSFYSYLDSSALYVNRRILATDSWTFTYDGCNPPAEIFETLDLGSHNNTTNISHSSEVNPGSYLSQYSEDQSDDMKMFDDVLVPQISPPEDQGTPLNVTALCDPSPFTKALYKLNFFPHDSDSIDIEGDMRKEIDEPMEEIVAEEDLERQQINIDNVVLSSDDDSTMSEFLVSLDLLEMYDTVPWHLEWVAITDLLAEHNIHLPSRGHRRLSLVSGGSTMDPDILEDLLPTRKTKNFERRLEAFDESVYVNPNASNLSISLGPFLTILFQRLRSMPTNNLFVNLLITGIISDLAAYPHPLIKNLLLDTDTILHPYLDKLHDIVLDIKEILRLQSQEIPNWERVLLNAYEYLYSRVDRPVESSPQHLKDADKSDTLTPKSSSRLHRFSFGLLAGSKKKDDGPLYRFPIPTVQTFLKPRSTNLESQNMRNLAYSWVIFDEFCKELASLCQEHTQHCFF